MVAGDSFCQKGRPVGIFLTWPKGRGTVTQRHDVLRELPSLLGVDYPRYWRGRGIQLLDVRRTLAKT